MSLTKNDALLFSFWGTDGLTLQFIIVCSVTTKILNILSLALQFANFTDKISTIIRNQKFMQLLLSKTSRVKAHCINFTY